MRFGLVHRVMTNLIAILGVLALVTSGQLSRVTTVLILVGLIASILVPESWQLRPSVHKLATVAPLLVLTLQVGRLAWGAPLLETTVEFAIALQLIRLATRRGAAQDQQVMILAWLHLIAGTVLGGGLAYAICFGAFLVVAPGALVLSHLRREVEGNYRQGARDRTGLPVDVPRILRSRRVVGRTFLLLTSLLSVPIFLFTAALFVLFPRVGLSLLLLNRPSTGRMVGFSDHVDLGGVGMLRSDPTVVLRVEVPGLPSPPPARMSFYLRGTALDLYDGRAWTRSSAARIPAERIGGSIAIQRYPTLADTPKLKIDLEPIDPPVIFLPANAIAMHVRLRGETPYSSQLEVLRGHEDEFRYLTPDHRGISYDVFTAPTEDSIAVSSADVPKEPYLSLPTMSPRVAALAHSWVEGAQTPYEKAVAIERHLRTEYQYDLATPSGAATDPLDHFLFESHRGHCEYFSTAMAVLLRQVDIPTRNVTGFVGGTYNRFGGYYTVRQADAHSWVEVLIPGQGWKRFDPTPPAGTLAVRDSGGMLATMRDMIEAMAKTWDHRVVRYDLQQQLWLFKGVQSRFSLASLSVRTVTQKINTEGRAPLVSLSALVVTAGASVFFIRWYRRRRGISFQSRGPRTEAERHAIEATALYQALEQAMAAARIPRSPGTPPLRHADQLIEIGHPAAAGIYQVTQRYLQARFGDVPLKDEEKSELMALIRQVRTAQPDAPAVLTPEPPRVVSNR